MKRLLLVYVTVLSVGGCCTFCKKPPVTIEKPVEVEVKCKLPPVPDLPEPKRMEICAGVSVLCFDMENSKKLIMRDSQQKQWIKEVLTRCK